MTERYEKSIARVRKHARRRVEARPLLNYNPCRSIVDRHVLFSRISTIDVSFTNCAKFQFLRDRFVYIFDFSHFSLFGCLSRFICGLWNSFIQAYSPRFIYSFFTFYVLYISHIVFHILYPVCATFHVSNHISYSISGYLCANILHRTFCIPHFTFHITHPTYFILYSTHRHTLRPFVSNKKNVAKYSQNKHNTRKVNPKFSISQDEFRSLQMSRLIFGHLWFLCLTK